MISLDQEFSLLKLVLKDASRVVYKWDIRGGQFQWSDNVITVLPFVGRETMTKESEWTSLIHPEAREQFSQMREHFIGKGKEITTEYTLKTQGDQVYHIRQTGTLVHDPVERRDYVIGMMDCTLIPEIQDTAPPVQVTARMESYSTGFLRLLAQAIEQSIQNSTSGILMIVSIKNLSMIINAHGHESSEQVMADLSRIITSTLPAGGVIERIHRDQFGLILPICTGDQARALSSAINISFQNYGSSTTIGALHVICSIGSVDFPGSARTAHDTVNRAYTALSRARGTIYRAFEDTMDESAQSRQQMGLANYLCKAIQDGRLRLAYQPIIESKTGTISHYEALLRLIGEDGKISSAGALIPIAERMGLIDVIDQIVFDMVVKELLGSPNVTLAFNVSNLTTENPRWLEHFTHTIERHPELASRIIVEITETAAQRDLRRTAYFVASLQAVGCQVALDDFGSGYTSFRQLKSLSVDMVKIDGAFIKDLAENADNRFFVKTLLDFTNGFGLKAVAEYVENGETAKMLMELGVEYMQGYYFGKPENHRGWLNTGEYEKE